MFIAIFIFIFLSCGIFCHYIAKRRKSNPVFWGVMGTLFGPVAIPFVFMSKSETKI